jgi:cardiolipin synthase
MKRSHILIILLVFLIVITFNFNKYIPSNYNTLIFLLADIISVIIAVSILLGNKKMESKIAWTMFVLFVPIIGFLFYMILGIEYNRFSKFDRKIEFDKDIDKLTAKQMDDIGIIINKLGNKKDIVDLIYKFNKSPVSLNNKTEVLTNGDVKFKRLFEELRNAKSFINIEYFIIKEGKIFDELKQILIEKAKEGIEIRILYDDFGCLDLPNKVLKEMQCYGIKTSCFNKINFKLFRPSINYRNHRKIVIIDDKVAFIGGLNIGDEYAHLDKYYGFWRDTHLLISGSAVRDLNMIFVKDWYHTTNELLIEKKYLTDYKIENEKSAIQIVSDGPDSDLGIMRGTFFKMINRATKRIWITTPYLILDNELISALKVAALSGIDVRIIVPGIPDKGKKVIYKATEAYFSELLEYGVKIYKYTDRFIHSKILIIDDDVASIGTVNFDYRSFDLHFEVTAILYCDPNIAKLVADYEQDLTDSKEILWREWKNRKPYQKMIESLVRVFSPLL